MSEPERLAWRWHRINDYLNGGEQQFPGRYLRLKYEELFEGPTPGIDRLAEWLGLVPNPDLKRAAKGNRIHASHQQLSPAWEDWDDESRSSLLERCGALMKLSGYEA